MKSTTAPSSQAVLTPFGQARQEFRSLFGDLTQRLRLWQLFALLQTLTIVILVLAYIRISGRAHVTPYIVEVDSYDRAVALGPAETLQQPEQRLLVFQLSQWIQNARSVYSDPHVQRDQILAAYSLLSLGRARAYLDHYYQQPENNPRLLGQNAIREIEVEAILPLSDHTWQIDWIEKTFPIRGADRPTSEPWRATVEIRIDPPRTAELVKNNPLGLWIEKVSWTRQGA